MKISIGVFVDSDSDIHKVEELARKGINCHLEFFHYSDFDKYKNDIPKALRVTSLHGFNSNKKESFKEYIKKLTELRQFFQDRNANKRKNGFMVTVHPNRFGIELADIDWLYPENFQYKKKKKLRTAMDILRHCGRLTLDTSHIDDNWVPVESLIRTMVLNADIIHLSQRSNNNTKSEHKPISVQGKIPIGLIIKTLRGHHNVKEIVLEYMPEYFHKAVKDYYNLPGLLNL